MTLLLLADCSGPLFYCPKFRGHFLLAKWSLEILCLNKVLCWYHLLRKSHPTPYDVVQKDLPICWHVTKPLEDSPKTKRSFFWALGYPCRELRYHTFGKGKWSTQQCFEKRYGLVPKFPGGFFWCDPWLNPASRTSLEAKKSSTEELQK